MGSTPTPGSKQIVRFPHYLGTSFNPLRIRTRSELDPHDKRKKIGRAIQATHENQKISDADKKHILKFDEFLAAKGLSQERRLVYLRTLPRIRVQTVGASCGCSGGISKGKL